VSRPSTRRPRCTLHDGFLMPMGFPSRGSSRGSAMSRHPSYFTSEQARKLVAEMRACAADMVCETLWPEIGPAALARTLGDRDAEP
jgi:hypothetical protein